MSVPWTLPCLLQGRLGKRQLALSEATDTWLRLANRHLVTSNLASLAIRDGYPLVYVTPTPTLDVTNA